jgi:ribosomal protein S18 acetylase RimI-like enzyme
VIVRRAEPTDLPDLLRLETHFPGDRLSRVALTRLLHGSADVWVAVDDGGRIVGDAIVRYRRGRPARLYSLVAEPAERGRGVGGALLAHAERAAAARGARSLVLEVRRDNGEAIAFYARRGYLPHGERDGYYEDGVGAHRLRKALR